MIPSRENHAKGVIKFKFIGEDEKHYEEFKNTVEELAPKFLPFELKDITFHLNENNTGMIAYNCDLVESPTAKLNAVTSLNESKTSVMYKSDYLYAQVTLFIKYITLELFQEQIEIQSDEASFKYKPHRTGQFANY